MKRTSWSSGLSVTADGVGVISHAGAIAPRLLADRVGLTVELSKAMTRRRFIPIHDRGRVLIDLAVMLADGGESISDIGVLRHQSEALGPVASAPTVWRTLDEITAGKRKKIQVARARTRRHVWSRLPGGVPASKCAGRDLESTVVLDVDATIVVTHSEKENAAPTYKRTFGYHPIGVWCDNTEEFLAASLRPGNAGSNTAADHIDVLGQAIAQIPAAHRRDLLIRSDGAGASHDLLDWITEQNRIRGRRVEYSVGFSITAPLRRAIAICPEAAWGPALNPSGDIRDGMRVIVRRERPHPGAQLSMFEEIDGWRYQAFVTNTATGQLQFLEARHRAHARVEDRIRHAKDTGLGRLPSREFALNQAWLVAVMLAADLVAWTRMLACTGDAAVLALCEPKALRYRFLHVAARLTRSGRRRKVKIPETWPWATAIVAVFNTIAAIPKPA
ncbi:IS1380 family transposase [Dietzia sp. UCD-THP]|uniref:IS1380 family transposase n=2 Tax=Dietzia TaxID=37914 RepID=UPI00039EF611|nr:IS1380 family transposase [Dietzia sp. UCD-THP]